ncbi:hypothetical protein AMR42_14260 [Limnothrix sp. PR1529]|nr:hypothetical protein BCR12_05925 [Limnothrix sp. P13C2]PIB07286.1 hypothetical protein AMR42_14260 [Limnothrix sp. PR1529]
MTPDQVFARLQEIFPRLCWDSDSSQHETTYVGMLEDGESEILKVTHWNESAGYHANRVDIELLESPRPQFRSIRSALEWLEWLQGVMSRT